MCPPRTSGIWPRVKARCCAKICVSEKLADDFVMTGVGVEVDFSSEMPELVGGDPYPNTSQNRALDRDPQRYQFSRCAVLRDEQTFWPSADHITCDLVAEGMEPIG